MNFTQVLLKKIITLCKNKTIDGCIAAHSVMNIFYILRKSFSVEQRKSILKEFCEFLDVVGIDKQKIISSLENSDFTDTEDCLQYECAKSCCADYIVTRNGKDFVGSIILVVTPEEFLHMLNM